MRARPGGGHHETHPTVVALRKAASLRGEELGFISHLVGGDLSYVSWRDRASRPLCAAKRRGP